MSHTNELIAEAAIQQFVCGDCKIFYDEDVLKEHVMTADQMAAFLKEHSKTIDRVEGSLFTKPSREGWSRS